MSHGLTSVCDNHANTIIKNQWKSERCGENELLDSIYLLWCTDWLQPDDVKKMFTHNFFLDVNDLKVSDVEAWLQEVGGKPAHNQSLVDKYVDAYEEVVPKQGLQIVADGLDGHYWK